MILEQSETVQITIRDTKDCFYLYEVPPSRVRKQVIGPRIHRSWLEHLDDDTWEVVDPDDIENWVPQDLRKTCASFEPDSELDFCQMGMTAIIMGDVNGVHTLECARRRQLFAARALNERSLLIKGLPFPRTKTIGDVYIDDLVILSVLQSSDVHVASSPIEVQRADALYDFLQMPTNAGKPGSTLAASSGEGTSTALQALSDSISSGEFRSSRCWSLPQVNRTPLRRLLGGWAFALAFRREAFACLDVAYTAASGSKQTMSSEWGAGRGSPCHRTRSSVGDELEGRTLREALRYRCLTEWCWRLLCAHHARGWARLEEKGEHVRLDWKGEEPPSNMHDRRGLFDVCHQNGALICVQDRGSANAPLSCGRRSPQRLCSLEDWFRIREAGVPVLGVIK